jgi:hypothetical protein
MRVLTLVLLFFGCGEDDQPTDSDVDPEDTADTGTDTGTDTDDPTWEPVVDMTGRWIVPDLAVLPGQDGPQWCEFAEVGDYRDETWAHNGEPVECHEGSVGGCRQDLEFGADGTVRRWVQYSADGPCPFNGVSQFVRAWEPWGTWKFAAADRLEVNGRAWVAQPLNAQIVNFQVDGMKDFSLSRGARF